MASRRKNFTARGKHAARPQHTNAEFMAGLLDGTIKATMIQLGPGNADAAGRVQSYDDPDPDRPGAPPDSVQGGGQ